MRMRFSIGATVESNDVFLDYIFRDDALEMQFEDFFDVISGKNRQSNITVY